MVLEWTQRLGLVNSKIDLSLLQHQSASQEKHGSMGDSSNSLLGILGPEDRRLCMRLALHVHYRPFLKRASETQNHGTRDRRLHEVSVCETCACVIHTINLYTLSALLLFARGIHVLHEALVIEIFKPQWQSFCVILH